MTEKDLFAPVRELFVKDGYCVNAEVKGCDMTALKDDELVIIELKKNLTVALLAQGLDRQRAGAKVYVAVPKPKNYSPRKFADTLKVIKKLELGLIFVTLRENHSFAEIAAEPEEYFPPASVNRKKRRAILDEINGRTVDMNVGGVTKKKIATAYTEKCIHIACILDTYGEMSAAELRRHGADEKAYSILHFNAYGWFKKVRKGVYGITDKGRRGLLEYPELEAYYTEKLLGG